MACHMPAAGNKWAHLPCTGRLAVKSSEVVWHSGRWQGHKSLSTPELCWVEGSGRARGHRGGCPPAMSVGLAVSEKTLREITALCSPCTRRKEKRKITECIPAARRKQKHSRCHPPCIQTLARTDTATKACPIRDPAAWPCSAPSNSTAHM